MDAFPPGAEQPYFRIEIERDAISLHGELDAMSAHLVQEAVAVVARSPRGIVLDARDLWFIDMAGVRVLISLAAADPARSVVLRDARPRVVKVLGLVADLLPENLLIPGFGVGVPGDGPGAWSRFAATATRSRELAARTVAAAARTAANIEETTAVLDRVRAVLLACRRGRGRARLATSVGGSPARLVPAYPHVEHSVDGPSRRLAGGVAPRASAPAPAGDP
jgi:anti-anti-sigma factor